MHVSAFNIYVGEPLTGSNIFFGGGDASTVRMKISTALRPSMNSPCDLGFVLSVIYFVVAVLCTRAACTNKTCPKRMAKAGRLRHQQQQKNVHLNIGFVLSCTLRI